VFGRLRGGRALCLRFQRSLDKRGRALQELLQQAAPRYVKGIEARGGAKSVEEQEELRNVEGGGRDRSVLADLELIAAGACVWRPLLLAIFRLP